MNKSAITDEEFIKITENCQTMAQASKLCGMSYRTYIAKAKALGIFHKIKNQGGKVLRNQILDTLALLIY